MARALLVALALLGVGAVGITGALSAAPAAAPSHKDEPDEAIDKEPRKETKDIEAFVVPVPSEIVAKVRKGDYGSKLAAAIDVRTHNYSGPSWKAALALGASFSDLVLGIDGLPKEKIVAGLADLKAGMTFLKLPGSRVKEIEELRAAAAADSLDKARLVESFDHLRADLLRHGKFELGAQNFGLLLVGGWARGANLAAQVAESHPAALNDLEALKVRGVIQTFIRLVGTGADVKPVVASLNEVLAITRDRPESLTEGEAAVIRKATREILEQI